MSARAMFGVPFAILLFILPLFTSAATCPNLFRTLQFGMSGSDVTSLQQFLIETGDLAPGNAIGFFGPRTRAAVKSFQCREMQICSGDEASTGWGRVGAMTRARIAQLCSSLPVLPPQSGLPYDPPQNSSCTLDNQTVPHNSSWRFYNRQSGTQAECTAAGLIRTCTNGTLSGSTAYQYSSCAYIGTPDSVPTSTDAAVPPTITTTNTDDPTPGTTVIVTGTRFTSSNDILLDGTPQQTNVGASENGTKIAFVVPTTYPTGTTNRALTVRNAHGTSNARYIRIRPGTTGGAAPTVSLTINGQQNVTVTPGSTFTIAWSSSNATSCTFTNSQNQTNPTPHNVSNTSQGTAPAAGTTFTYKFSCTNSAGTTEKTASITGSTTGGGGTNPTAGTCMYKGQVYGEDATVSLSERGPTFTCDNSTWTIGMPTASEAAWSDACDFNHWVGSTRSDLGCGSFSYKAELATSKRHKNAPYTVTVATIPLRGLCDQQPYTIYWGDGSQDVVSNYGYCDTWKTNTHTYQSSGSYTISYTDRGGYSNSARIRVDGPTASAQNQSQLANALTALQGALQSILQLLGR